ncbi:MAG: type II toxin-antitoxin system VapC family toxin [Rhodothermales bacterium]|nr:type II toxin-antitoxin system VapC family toxin [Rhodothermales bacterium]
MIVVDTSVLAYHLLRWDPGHAAMADRVRSMDADWRVAPIWRAEFRNVLASYMRFRSLSLAAAVAVMAEAEAQLHKGELEIRSHDVLALAAESNQTAYDCEFVAAAASVGTVLVTGDRKLASAFPGLAVTMEEFAGAG